MKLRARGSHAQGVGEKKTPPPVGRQKKVPQKKEKQRESKNSVFQGAPNRKEGVNAKKHPSGERQEREKGP